MNEREAKAAKRERQKIEKYKKDFLDTNSNLANRTKALLKFISIETDEGIGALFRENYVHVFSSFFEIISSTDANLKKGKHPSEKDCKVIFDLIHRIITHLPNDLRDLRNAKNILTTLEKFLYIEASHQFRKEALEALMMFIEAVPDNIDALKLLLEALNFQTFTNDSPGIRPVLPRILSSRGDKTIVYIPSGTISGKKEAADILDTFLTYTERTPESFQFWLGTINAVIAYMFPEAASRAGIEGATAVRGFVQGTAPGDLVTVLFRHITTKWFTEERYLAPFCYTGSIYGLLFDFLKAAAGLSMETYLDTITEYTTAFYLLIMYQKTFDLPNIPRESRISFQITLLDMCTEFFASGFSKDVPELQKFLKTIISHYVQCISLVDKLDIAVYKTLLYSLLKASSNLLANPHSNPVLVAATKNEFLNILFSAWVSHYTIVDEQMWEVFQQTLAPIMDRSALVNQVRYKLIHLTLLVKDKCYPATSPVFIANAGTAPSGGNNNSNSESNAGEGKHFKKKNIWTLEARESPDKPGLRESGLPDVDWDINGLLYVWGILFQLLCGVNEITSPTTYESVVLIITDVMDILIWAEDCSNILPTEDELNIRIPLMPTFACILFSICRLGDPTRNSGVARAFGGLCRLFCRRNALLPLDLLSYFYSAIRCGLALGARVITWEILVNSYNIFSLEVPGALILVPEYIAAAREILCGSHDNLHPNATQAEVTFGVKKFVSMIVSLISYPHQFQTLSVAPSAPDSKGAPASPYTAASLRAALVEILVGTINNAVIDSEAKQMALWGLAVAIADDIMHFGGDRISTIVDKVVSCINDFKDDLCIQRTALQSLSYIGTTYATKVPTALADKIVSSVARSIVTMSQSRSTTSAPTLVQGFLCLAVWLSSPISSSAYTKDTRNLIFQAIDNGINYGLSQKSQPPPTGDGAAQDAAGSGPNSQRPASGSVASLSTSVGGDAAAMTSSNGPAEERRSARDNPACIGVREAAEVLLRQLLYYRNSFPLREGVDMMTSKFIPQTIGSSTPFAKEELFNYVYGSETELSASGIQEGAAARVALRESGGKWVWDFTPVHIAKELDLPLNEASALDNYEFNVEVASARASAKYADTNSVCALPPPLSPENKVSALFRRTEETYPEVQVLSDTTTSLAEFAENTASTVAEIDGLCRAEDAEKPRARPVVSTAPPKVERDCGATMRQFMQQFGFLSPISEISGKVQRLAMSEKSGRSMLLFDKTPDRASHKIGLIYVKEGQTTQNEILANSAGSPLYNDFVAGLGWVVDIATHRGYLGGIDKSFVAGNRTVYWSNSLDEVIFHEVTRMPTSDSDPQQIHKKRHVGNDFVHVIWCEGLRDYNPLTITSQFNEAHIVIYPQEGGLCRIQIFRNLENPLFGPLQHGMIVPKDELPSLVRETAINANRIIAARITEEPFSRPIYKKKKMFSETFNKVKDNISSLSTKMSNLVMNEIYYSSDMQQQMKQQEDELRKKKEDEERQQKQMQHIQQQQQQVQQQQQQQQMQQIPPPSTLPPKL